MKYIFLFLTAFLITPLFAQDWTVGTRWLYEQFDFIPSNINDYVLFEISADTIIEGDNFVKLEEYYVKIINGQAERYERSTYLVRKSGNQVWVRGQFTEQSYLLYDFDAVQGDTLQLKVAGPFTVNDDEYVKVLIDSVGTMSYNGVQWPVQYITNIFEPDTHYALYADIVKGVGALNYLFPAPGFVDPTPGGYLICFSNGDTMYPGGVGCDFLLPTVEVPGASVKVFPNPATSLIQVDGEGLERWELLFINGRKKMEGKMSEIISVNGLDAGTYLLVLYDKNKVRHLQKIVVASR